MSRTHVPITTIDRQRITALFAVATIAAVSLVGCSAATTNGANGAKTLVVDNNFDLQTLDPARAFEFTDATIVHQVYETALTYIGSDIAKLVPGIATYVMSPDDTVVTLTLDGTHTFADGSAVSADDIVFSYQRLEGIQGNPAYLLDDPAGVPVVAAKVNDTTVTLTSSVPNPALPTILPNPALSVLQKKVLVANGGTTGTDDKAEKYLNEHSLGSAAYQIESSNITSRVVMTLNPKFAGTKPVYTRIVYENVLPSTQKVNIQSGKSQLAFDVDPQSATEMAKTGKVSLIAGPSLYTVYAWFNQLPEYGGPAANQDFLQAIRHGINYKEILALAGPGSVQPGGVVPQGIIGALKSDPNNSYDPDAAKKFLAKSGYKGEDIQFLVDSSVSAGNASFESIAQAIQAQLVKIGVNLKLVPQPSVTALDTFRSGTFQGGMTQWGADFPDPADYVAFAPDQNVGVRAGWKTGAGIPSADNIMPSFDKALNTFDEAARITAWQDVQTEMNQTGPFIPFLQPGSNIVFSSALKNVTTNPLWGTQFSTIK